MSHHFGSVQEQGIECSCGETFTGDNFAERFLWFNQHIHDIKNKEFLDGIH